MSVVTQWDQVNRQASHAALGSTVMRGRPPAGDLQSLEQRQFLSMERSFGAHGGLLSGEEVSLRLRARCDQPISVLARWIVARKILSLTWHTQTLIPMFQFDQRDMTLRNSVTQVFGELQEVFDDWELALWFAQPNAWLRDASPVDLVAIDDSAVLDAARADRFVARGC